MSQSLIGNVEGVSCRYQGERVETYIVWVTYGYDITAQLKGWTVFLIPHSYNLSK